MNKEVKSPRKRNVIPAIEARRRARLERESKGVFPAYFMRLSLTDDAFAIVRDMDNASFRDFVSTAIRKAAKKR